MSARSRGRAPGPRPAAPARPSRWPAALAGTLLLIAIVAWWRWHASGPLAPAARLDASPAPDSAATLDIHRAYAAAKLRVDHGDCLASLPYYRRIGALLASDAWEYHLEYAIALQGASVQIQARSSWERQRLMHEALDQIDRAEPLAHGARDRATIIATRAKQLRIWGLPWETLLEFRRAQAADPSWRECAESADLYAGILRRPANPRE